MTYPESNIKSVYEWIGTLPHGAKKWFARNWILYLTNPVKLRPDPGHLSAHGVAEVKLKIQELLDVKPADGGDSGTVSGPFGIEE